MHLFSNITPPRQECPYTDSRTCSATTAQQNEWLRYRSVWRLPDFGALYLNHTCLKVSLYTCYKLLWFFFLPFIRTMLRVHFCFPSSCTPASTRQPNTKPFLSWVRCVQEEKGKSKTFKFSQDSNWEPIRFTFTLPPPFFLSFFPKCLHLPLRSITVHPNLLYLKMVLVTPSPFLSLFLLFLFAPFLLHCCHRPWLGLLFTSAHMHQML